MTPEEIPLEEDSVSIVFGKWTKEVALQLGNTTEWGVSKLHLWYNSRATVVKEIAHIHFTALTELDLEQNLIQSIEGLACVDMPHIKKLLFNDNRITSVRVIRKAHWPTMQQLSMWNNYFGDAKFLIEGYLPELNILEVYYSGGDKNPFTEQGFTFKMQALYLSCLWIRKKKFCFDCSTRGTLEEKWPGAQIL